jgi:hypothetical protein
MLVSVAALLFTIINRLMPISIALHVKQVEACTDLAGEISRIQAAYAEAIRACEHNEKTKVESVLSQMLLRPQDAGRMLILLPVSAREECRNFIACTTANRGMEEHRS